MFLRRLVHSLPLAFVATATLLTAAEPPRFGLVLHGGAGVIRREDMTPALEAEYRQRLGEALDAGYAVLDRGGTALDAVVTVIRLLEDSPLFNAGKGAVFNADGVCELDASIMDGRTLAAGAVAGVQTVRHPISLARDVMEKSPHVMLAGRGAEQFAASLGYEVMPPDYFQTESRRQQWLKARAKEQGGAALPAAPTPVTAADAPPAGPAKHGTVGCAALDRHGNLAAGTSTGGMTYKRFGRVGDSPIIGAGTYASNATCAVSCTGWGEYFIRVGVARDIAARMEYQGRTLREAAAATLASVAKLGGDGGVVGIDARGQVMMEFNTPGMYRAHRVAGGAAAVAIFGDEKR